jgi:short-subunit dehydrogenase
MAPAEVQPVALITGASGGIGYEIARVLARRGYALVIVGRHEATLLAAARSFERDYQSTVTVIEADLSRPGGVESIAQRLREEKIFVDVLVNNAGVALRGEFVESDAAAVSDMLQVNIVALTRLTRLLLPAMVARGRGRVLNLASMGAYMPGPLLSVYFASKAYVLSFSEALSQELRGSGVTATVLCPGPTETGFAARAGLVGTKAFSSGVMSAESVAEIGVRAMFAGKTAVIPGVRNWLPMLPIGLLPRSVLAWFARKFHEVPADRPARVTPPAQDTARRPV